MDPPTPIRRSATGHEVNLSAQPINRSNYVHCIENDVDEGLQDVRPLVYVGMASDIIHHGHIAIIKKASKYGRVVVGLLTDEAIESYKRTPILKFEHRKLVIENIKGVDHVVPQTTHDYRPNLRLLRPQFVVHGDDWKVGPQRQVRQQVIDELASWGGELIEPQYTKDMSTTQLIERCYESIKAKISQSHQSSQSKNV